MVDEALVARAFPRLAGAARRTSSGVYSEFEARHSEATEAAATTETWKKVDRKEAIEKKIGKRYRGIRWKRRRRMRNTRS